MTLWRVARQMPALISIMLLALISAAVLAAPLLASGQGGFDETPLRAPSAAHPFGTDYLGRDLFDRVLNGGRVSLPVGLLVVGLSVIISLPLGLVAGCVGGLADELVMRTTDIFLSIPQLLLSMLLAAALGANAVTLVLSLVAGWWPWYCRLARAQAVTLRSREYNVASQALGAGLPWIIARHIAPNAMPAVLIQATSDLGAAILTASALSFLGLGVQPPATDWGQLVSEGRAYFPAHWWYVTFPGGAIFIVAYCMAALGDTLRSWLSRRSRQRLTPGRRVS